MGYPRPRCLESPVSGRHVLEATRTLFGTRARPPRPVLLLLVYGAFLAIVGDRRDRAVGAGRGAFLDRDLDRARRQRRGDDPGVRQRLRPADRPLPGDARRRPRTSPGWRRNSRPATARRDPARRASPPRRHDRGRERSRARRRCGPPDRPISSGALDGDRAGRHRAGAEAGAGPGTLASPTLLREFLPLSVDGKVLGVVGIWRDAVPILERLDQMRREVVDRHVVRRRSSRPACCSSSSARPRHGSPARRPRSSSRPGATR